MPRHLACAVQRHLEKGLVDEPHEFEVLRPLARRLPLERRPRDRHEFILAHDGESCVIATGRRLPPIKVQRSKAFAKKSRSTTSWPILACSFVTSASRFA